MAYRSRVAFWVTMAFFLSFLYKLCCRWWSIMNSSFAFSEKSRFTFFTFKAVHKLYKLWWLWSACKTKVVTLKKKGWHSYNISDVLVGYIWSTIFCSWCDNHCCFKHLNNVACSICIYAALPCRMPFTCLTDAW